MTWAHQLQLRDYIENHKKPWDLSVGFTMPGPPKLYHDHPLTDESALSSAYGKIGGLASVESHGAQMANGGKKGGWHAHPARSQLSSSLRTCAAPS